MLSMHFLWELRLCSSYKYVTSSLLLGLILIPVHPHRLELSKLILGISGTLLLSAYPLHYGASC